MKKKTYILPLNPLLSTSFDNSKRPFRVDENILSTLTSSRRFIFDDRFGNLSIKISSFDDLFSFKLREQFIGIFISRCLFTSENECILSSLTALLCFEFVEFVIGPELYLRQFIYTENPKCAQYNESSAKSTYLSIQRIQPLELLQCHSLEDH